MIQKRPLLVPFALCAMGISLAILSGCRKEQQPPAGRPPMASVDERMADKDYVKQLDAQRDEQKRLAAKLNSATNDAQRKAAAQQLEVNRLKTAEIVRARMAASNKKISK